MCILINLFVNKIILKSLFTVSPESNVIEPSKRMCAILVILPLSGAVSKRAKIATTNFNRFFLRFPFYKNDFVCFNIFFHILSVNYRMMTCNSNQFEVKFVCSGVVRHSHNYLRINI